MIRDGISFVWFLKFDEVDIKKATWTRLVRPLILCLIGRKSQLDSSCLPSSSSIDLRDLLTIFGWQMLMKRFLLQIAWQEGLTFITSHATFSWLYKKEQDNCCNINTKPLEDADSIPLISTDNSGRSPGRRRVCNWITKIHCNPFGIWFWDQTLRGILLDVCYCPRNFLSRIHQRWLSQV